MAFLREIRRSAFIALWTLAATWVWLVFIVGVLFGDLYCQRHFGWPPLDKSLPDWVPWGVPLGGVMVIAVGVLVLGVLGRLPGTAERAGQGFPIDQSLRRPEADDEAVRR